MLRASSAGTRGATADGQEEHGGEQEHEMKANPRGAYGTRTELVGVGMGAAPEAETAMAVLDL